MEKRNRGLLAALVLALLGVAPALHAAGNGGFWFIPGYNVNGKHAQVQVFVDCKTEFNYVCGLTSTEIDWDDGSAFDNYVGYLPHNEAEFEHDYYENGTYYADLSSDDDHGNWAAVTLTLTTN